MAKVCNNPLMLQGFMMGASVVAAGAVVSRQAIIQQQRGHVKYLDVMEMLAPGVTTNMGTLITVATGGNTLLQTIPASMFMPDAYTQPYKLVCVDIEPGQTVNWTYDNSGSANANNATLHLYYENPWLLDAAHMAKFDQKARGLKERVYVFTAGASVKAVTTGEQQLPSSQGRVIGFQLFAENVAGTVKDVYQGIITVLINGEQVVLNACLGIGYYGTSRPYMRFPIDVPESGTFQINVDNSLSATANRYGIKFFFDQE